MFGSLFEVIEDYNNDPKDAENGRRNNVTKMNYVSDTIKGVYVSLNNAISY